MNRLLPIGLMLLLLSTIHSFSQGFTISGTKLLDANKNEFIIHGVSNPHIWIPQESFEALDRIAALNVNCVRIVWQTNGKAQQLETIIKRCIELKMIPMVELHDVTGDASGEKLLKTVEYYTQPEIKNILLTYERYLLINLANEWGNHQVTSEYWKTSYQKAVELLRNAGIKTTLVIDGPGWGQNIKPIIEKGNELLNADKEKNILFSVHMYGSWNNSKEIETELQKAHDVSIPLIVGEFGYNFKDGDNNLKCKVDHKTIINTCQELGYGYMPWSWSGNNEENAWLDLSDWKNLTWWGKEVFEGEKGIIRTAKRCSVFTEK